MRMRTASALFIGIVIGGAFFGGLHSLKAQAVNPPAIDGLPGTYQVQSDGGSLRLLDTRNGRLWYRVDADWSVLDTPPQGADVIKR